MRPCTDSQARGELEKLSAAAIQLHVFGHNQAARALYEKMGYETTNVIMAKKLAKARLWSP